VESPKIIVRTYSSENQICFEIEDNGCGIPSRHLENIYEPSFTLKGGRDLTGSYKPGIKGTGYGMSNIKKYIELHRGRIFVESTFKSHSDSGTKFTICLPVISRELTLEEKNQVRKDILYSGQDILLVEDESAISDVQYRILTQEPCCHRVDIAQNGQAAMDLFQKNHYDLVSLDYLLPGEMNGVDVYHHIRKTNKNIPIVFVSGNITFLESIKDLKQKDAYIDHLSKPCSNKDYVAGINKFFVKLSNQQMQDKRAGTVNDSPDN
jgi:CheY-like chemotaxis protein